MRKEKGILFVSLFFLIFGYNIGMALCAEVTVFGPKKYVRTKGKPNLYSDIFSGSPGQAKLVIYNGDGNGKNQVNSGQILLNGKEVAGSGDFGKKVDNKQLSVILMEKNAISVELRSSPGSYIILEIEQDIASSSPLKIISPVKGETLFKPYARVEGTIIKTGGEEIGIKVNEVLAIVYGDRFVANSVYLKEGENTITATATDGKGNKTETSTIINALTTGGYLRIRPDREVGIPPLNATLSLEGTFGFGESTLTYTGPGPVDIVQLSKDRYSASMTAEGVYYFTAQAKNSQNEFYSDTIAIVVLNKGELDALCQEKWNGMKAALQNQDPIGASGFFIGRYKTKYEYNFVLMREHLSAIASGLRDIRMVKVEDRSAEYEMRAEQDGRISSFQILFVKDADGVWRIGFF